jgi:glycosyltransferase involved in cell wall biosynthesis
LEFTCFKAPNSFNKLFQDNNKKRMPKEILHKITFATVCMNRLHHICQTLPQNIADNSGYENVDFLLLDYNSTDGLEDWIKNHMQEYILNGKLTFYRTNQPEYFNRSHSRNQILRMANGDIICNVDADNYTGAGFAHYINQEFSQDSNIFLAGSYMKEYAEYKDSYGRFCAWKKDFVKVGGYDEEMESYGHEDTDLYERMTRLGRREINIMNFDFLHSIAHSDQERTGNEFFRKNLSRFYMAYLSDKKRKVLFLYKNGTFEEGTLVENYYTIHSPSSIEEGGWLKGKWHEDGHHLVLEYKLGTPKHFYTDSNRLNYSPVEQDEFYLYTHITNKTMLNNTLLSYSIITNSNRIHQNEISKKILVNENKGSYGQGIVFKNFNYEQEIILN